MKILNCTWDKENLGKRTCEVILCNEDLDLQPLLKIQSEYDYIVVKVPKGNVNITQKLSELGFYFVESQIALHYRISDYNKLDKMAKYYLPKMSLIPCDDRNSKENVLKCISEGMFSTDRIALDNHFGLTMSKKRYRNWINNTMQLDNYRLCDIKLSSMRIGFSYLKIEGESVDYVLGGLYPEYQGRGFGIVEPLAACLYINDNGLKYVDTNVSSNNIDVLKCYMKCGYSIEDFKYVFAKVVR